MVDTAFLTTIYGAILLNRSYVGAWGSPATFCRVEFYACSELCREDYALIGYK